MTAITEIVEDLLEEVYGTDRGDFVTFGENCYRAAMKWIKCSDRTPPEGVNVLLLMEGCAIEGKYRTDYGYWDVVVMPSHGCGCCAESNPAPTHWMPLPEKPISNNEEPQ